MDENKLKRLEEVFKLLDNSLTTEDFIKSFEQVMKVVEEVKRGNEKEFELMHDAIDSLKKRMQDDVSTDLSVAKEQVMEYCKTEMSKVFAEHAAEMHDMGSRMEEMVSQRKSDEERVLETIRAEIPELPEVESTQSIRDRLARLRKGSKLPIKAIEGLEEKLSETVASIESASANRVQTPAKAFRVHIKDATAQCDGANKTFTVGGTHFGILGVFGTQFPQVYRPVIDYTETKTGILLTAAVGAPETDQTLIIQFLK